MNWEKLKVFKKVAKAGSFLTASKQDNKSQSTFSRAVMDLEKEINQKLFNRTSKGSYTNFAWQHTFRFS